LDTPPSRLFVTDFEQNGSIALNNEGTIHVLLSDCHKFDDGGNG